MQRIHMLSFLFVLAIGASASAEPIKPAEYLASLDRPVFREGHTLLPLTRYGWTLSYDARVELAKHWGYALEFGGYVDEKRAAKLDDPESLESQLVELVKNDPKTYKLSVICSRRLPYEEAPIESWSRDADGKLLDAKAQSLDGTQWQKGMRLVWSPEAPDSVWKMAGRFRADPIAKVRERCPITIVLNGGEYGLGVLGFAQVAWEKDPTVLEAKGDLSWYDYISARKAHAETLIANEVKSAVPDRRAYIYYTTTGGTHRNRHRDWYRWMYGYEWMKPVSDLASSEHYYMHFNSGWTGKDNLLTQALNAKGFEIVNDSPLGYEWLCAGWPREKGMGSDKSLDDQGLGDLTRYMGFLKCLYVSGMIGGNAGYYAYPKGGFDVAFESNDPPHWIGQMVAFSRVHAMFSYLEDYIRDGDLLPGPDQHIWSKDQPAYEFPTADPDVRVLVRKRKGQPIWLVAAWAAGGEARDVTVTIPEAGEVTLNARPGGSVYIARSKNGKLVTHLTDANATRPSLSFQRETEF